MKEYVVGFLFDSARRQVVLIEKKRPAWQTGKWNGVGGKVEAPELPPEAMRREFDEETGVDMYGSWECFATLETKGGVIYFFRGFSDKAFDVASRTDEEVSIWAVDQVTDPFFARDFLANTPWLVSMALSIDADAASYFIIQEKYPDGVLRSNQAGAKDVSDCDAPADSR